MSTVDFHSTTPTGPTEDGTLDLTKLKLTLGQLLAFVILLSGLIGTSAVSLYQLTEVRKAQDRSADAQAAFQADITKRLGTLETDKAARDAFERGRQAATTGGR